MADQPNVFTIPAGAPFLETLGTALFENRLVPNIAFDRDNLDLASTTIYVPTRRAARSLRAVLSERIGGDAAILPLVRPLGDFDDDSGWFDSIADAAELAPPVGAVERILTLAPLVKAWKNRLPAHIAALFGENENLVVPVSAADSIWLARDLAHLIDAVETENADWAELSAMVPEDLAGWWQLTVDFLKIITEHWPNILKELDRSNPAAYRNAMIDAETARIKNGVGRGAVIAAGSTGSIPATSRLLAAIASHPRGALVLPGLDMDLDEASWNLIDSDLEIAICGHPQFGLKKLLSVIGISRNSVIPLTSLARHRAARARLVSEALRPAETTDLWLENAPSIKADIGAGAFDNVSLIEAANEREEAVAVAIALRQAVSVPNRRAALVTSDRDLARRVSSELLRFGIMADDSGGRPLSSTPPATLLQLIAETAFRPGDPTVALDLFSHPLFLLGRAAPLTRRAGALIELILLRGSGGKTDLALLPQRLHARRDELLQARHAPFWLSRISAEDWKELDVFLTHLHAAFQPLYRLREKDQLELPPIITELVRVMECLGRDGEGTLSSLYAGDQGAKLAEFLRSLLVSGTGPRFHSREFPDLLAALIAQESVKPTVAADGRVAIWGVLEARLQSVDTLIIGGLNEGSWPRKAETGRFVSRGLAAGLGLDPPERRIGQAAHDMMMALGNENIVLSRSVRVEGEPSTRSRWLQRILAVAGPEAARDLAERGKALLELASVIDSAQGIALEKQPCPTPPIDARPRHFSVTEIETLRRDPYAIYARRILKFEPLQPLSAEPAAADRGALFHEILHRFAIAGIDPASPLAAGALEEIGRTCFTDAGLPENVITLWWPRFLATVPNLLAWEKVQAQAALKKFSEIASGRLEIGQSGVTLSGRADRIEILQENKMAQIIDFKTGSNPTRSQAHALLAPQLALEGALVQHGVFADLGAVTPTDLVYVRLKQDGTVDPESILKKNGKTLSARELSDKAWGQLQRLVAFYARMENGYRSRALPFRERDMSGDYDHLARVQEWASAGDADEAGAPE